ncbi:MAG: zinc-finger domain-containing protein [Alphaproteobacteria bacterium]|jgi:uncharacterized Zn-finger protein|nr:zinc-finger domain-containing protein [Candidatus Jidaibacter sp.]
MEKVVKIEHVDNRHVSCDGGSGALGHPKVYLEIKKDKNIIDCPYCGKKFVIQDHKSNKQKK